jgi:hypothetical protein
MYSSYGSYNRRQPFFVLGKFPMHITQIVFALLIVGLLATIFLGADNVLFSTALLIQRSFEFKWWTPLSYVWFTMPEFWSIVGLVFFAIYGSRIESEMDRQWFAGLMLYLWLAPPLMMIAASPLGKVALTGPHLVGTSLLLGYCFMHPHQLLWCRVPIKWLGLIVMVAEIGRSISLRHWPDALTTVILWIGMYALLRFLGHTREWNLPAEIGISWERKNSSSSTKSKHSSRLSPKLKPRTVVDLKARSALDAILDKINAEGIHSLTDKEKAILKNTSDEFAE